MPCKHVREFFHVFPNKYLEKSDILFIFAHRIIIQFYTKVYFE